MLQNLENFESMPFMSKIESLRAAAKFHHPIEIENSNVTTLLEDDGWRRRTSMCKEYTAPRSQKDSRPFASTDANQKIDPILNIGVPGIEVQVPSLSDLCRPIWILTSRGKERFVNEIHSHKLGIVNDSSLLRLKEENLENVSFESVKLDSGNRGYGSEDSGAAKSNDKPSNELRKTAISTTFATSSRSCNSIVQRQRSQGKTEFGKRFLDARSAETIPVKLASPNVSRIWFDTMTNTNVKKMVRCM